MKETARERSSNGQSSQNKCAEPAGSRNRAGSAELWRTSWLGTVLRGVRTFLLVSSKKCAGQDGMFLEVVSFLFRGGLLAVGVL